MRNVTFVTPYSSAFVSSKQNYVHTYIHTYCNFA